MDTRSGYALTALVEISVFAELIRMILDGSWHAVVAAVVLWSVVQLLYPGVQRHQR